MIEHAEELTMHVERPDGLADADWEACKRDIAGGCGPIVQGLLRGYHLAAPDGVPA